MTLKTAEDVLDALTTPKTASDYLGRDLLFHLVDRRELAQITQALTKAGDTQSVQLLREIRETLIERLSVDDRTEDGLTRLINMVKAGKNWDHGTLRNNVFKIANSLGLSLPSGMFASMKTSSLTMRDVVNFERLVASNHSTQALLILARYFKLSKFVKLLEGIEMVHSALGYLPDDLEKIRLEHSKKILRVIHDSKESVVDVKGDYGVPGEVLPLSSVLHFGHL